MTEFETYDFIKTQRFSYLENETLFFLQINKFINYTSRASLWQKNSFVEEVTFKAKSTHFSFRGQVSNDSLFLKLLTAEEIMNILTTIKPNKENSSNRTPNNILKL